MLNKSKKILTYRTAPVRIVLTVAKRGTTPETTVLSYGLLETDGVWDKWTDCVGMFFLFARFK